MILPKISDNQLTILLFLYKFRFLTTNQIARLLNYPYASTAQLWLKQLRVLGYVRYKGFDRKKFGANTKQAIYHLTKLARKRLKTEKKCDLSVLNRVYQEETLSLSFINRYVFLADIYLNLLKQEGKNLKYFTKDELKRFDYPPKPLPDAYIAIKGKKKTKRYFLFLLDETAPWYAQEIKIKKYLEYADDNTWAEYTKDPLPSFLFICPERFKNKIYKLISETLVINGSFYLATKSNIQYSGFKSGAWEKVE